MKTLIFSLFLSLFAPTNLATVPTKGSPIAATTDGLVAYYSFDGNANDSQGSNNGTAVGGPTYTTGKIGQAMQFDGVDDYVNVGDMSVLDFDNTQSFSYGVWYKSTAKQGSKTLIGKKQNSGSPTIGYMIELDDNWIRAVYSDGTTNTSTGIIGGNTNDNQWHHMFIVVDRSQNKIIPYLDGVALSSGTDISTIGSFVNSMSFIIGSAGNGGGKFNGLIDDVRVYSKALSSLEVSELYVFGGGSLVSTPTNGQCSTTLNVCTLGTLDNTSDSSTYYLWSCTGSNGGTTASCSLPIDTSTPTDPQTTYSLSISRSGTGSGTVTGTGINCGSDCSETLNTGTSITLTTTPATGSTFSSWGGSCSGTSNTCTITLNTNTSVTANFTTNTTTQTITSGTYYIDFDSGNDANSGSISSPWKHAPGDINATGNAKSVVLKPGDKILFKGGVKYRGWVDIQGVNGTASNPIIYDGMSWGNGKAIIDGSEPVPNWTRCSSKLSCGNNDNWQNIFYATVPVSPNFAVHPAVAITPYQDESPLSTAQFPDALNPLYPMTSGFLTVPYSSITNTTLRDSRLDNMGSDLIGKYVYLWVEPNAVVIRKITGFNSSTITFPSASVYTNRDTYYAIINSPHSSVLDKAGEYYLDESLSRLYVWPLNNTDLSQGQRISVTKEQSAFVFREVNYITVRGFVVKRLSGDHYAKGAYAFAKGSSGLTRGIIISDNEIFNIRAQATAIMSLFGVSDMVIKNNYVYDSGVGRGIQGSGTNVKVTGNIISNIGGTGIYTPGCQDCLIANNTIKNGRAAHANGISVYSGANNVIVANNTVLDSNIAFTYEQSSNVHLYNNIFDGNENVSYVAGAWGGMTSTNNVMNNIIVGSSNNTAFLSTGGDSKADLYIVRNNILDGGGIAGGSNSLYKSNNIYTGLSWWQSDRYGWALTPSESLVTDQSKLFTNVAGKDFRPAPNSPAIGKGINLTSYCVNTPELCKDMYGNPRPSGITPWTIGAVEPSGDGVIYPENPPTTPSTGGGTTSGGTSSSGGGVLLTTNTQTSGGGGADITQTITTTTQSKTGTLIPTVKQPNTTTTPGPTPYKFTQTLRLKSIGSDVRQLQIFLNQKGFTIAKRGLGSKGKETTKFGVATRSALIKFQRFYKLPRTGVLDLKTRNKVNGMK